MDTKTLYSKLAAVPPPIKTWLGSDEIVDYVNNIDNQFLLPQGSSSVIKKLAQRVLIKDIAPEYFSGELATELKLDKDKAMHISGEIKKTIFFPEKTAFSEYGINIDLLDKFQMPGIKASVVDSPKILGDVGTPERAGTEPTPKKPSVLSDVGWSRSSSAEPGIQLSAVPAASGSTHTPPPTPVPPAPPSPKEPAPVMLHEDTSFKAVEKNAGFTLSKPGAGAEVHMGSGVPQATARPAVLEFGGAKPPTPQQNKPSATPSLGATHYTELKLSLSAVPTANMGPRKVSQVAAPIPKPPTSVPVPPVPKIPSAIPQPPRPPQVPQPPKPPQNSKPIVKDFL